MDSGFDLFYCILKVLICDTLAVRFPKELLYGKFKNIALALLALFLVLIKDLILGKLFLFLPVRRFLHEKGLHDIVGP